MSRASGGAPALDPLLAPSSIALVGISQNPDTFAGRLYANLRDRFTGELFLVNPRYDRVDGQPCYPSLADLPDGCVPDTALVLTGASGAVDIVEQAESLGIAAATIYAAGFGEAGGAGREHLARLQRIASRGRIQICGPNTIGVANFSHGAVMMASANVPPSLEPGPLALVSQSGGTALTFLSKAYARGLPVGIAAVIGNAVALGTTDYIRYLTTRDEITTIAVYVEAIPDVPDLADACLDAVEAGKTMLMCRAGRTAVGASMAASHTGVLTQGPGAIDDILASVGVLVHGSVETLFESTYAAVRCGRVRSPVIALYSSSGGANVQAADCAIESGLEFAQLTPHTVEFLATTYPFATPANPYDPTGLWRNQPEHLSDCVAAMANDPSVSAFIQVLPTQHASYAWDHVDVVEQASRRTDTPIITASISAGPLTRPVEDALRERGIPVFESMEACFGALARLGRHNAARRWRRLEQPYAPLPADRAASFHDAIGGRVGSLDEVVSKRVMRSYAIPVVEEITAQSADEAVDAAERVGYPVVLKALVPGLTHKTDVGGVELGVGTRSAVEAAYARLCSATGGVCVVVQPMVSGIAELIIGARRDEQLGPVVMMGAGGILAEFLDDVTVRRAPIDVADGDDMLSSLRVSRLLDGLRGRRRAKRADIVDVVTRLSWLIAENPAVREVDLNPVIVTADGPIVVDAAVMTSDEP